MRFVLAAAAAMVAAVPAQAATTFNEPRGLFVSGTDPVTGFTIISKLQYDVFFSVAPNLETFGYGLLTRGSLRIADLVFDTSNYTLVSDAGFLRVTIDSGNPFSGNYYSFSGIQAEGFLNAVPRNLVYRVNGVNGVLDIADLTVRPLANGVPEPSTWAMMIVGFGLVGGMMRRRVGFQGNNPVAI